MYHHHHSTALLSEETLIVSTVDFIVRNRTLQKGWIFRATLQSPLHSKRIVPTSPNTALIYTILIIKAIYYHASSGKFPSLSNFAWIRLIATRCQDATFRLTGLSNWWSHSLRTMVACPQYEGGSKEGTDSAHSADLVKRPQFASLCSRWAEFGVGSRVWSQ